MRAAWLVLLLAAPTAQAALRADGLTYDGSATLDGHLALLQLRSDPDSVGGSPWIQIAAGHIEATQYNSTKIVSATDAGNPLTYPENPPVGTPYDLGSGVGRLAAFRGVYRLNLYAPDGVEVHAEAMRGDIVSRGPVTLSAADISDRGGAGAPCPGDRPDAPRFCAIERAGPLLLHTSTGSRANATLRAPILILELTGIDLRFDAQRSIVLQSGHFPESLAPVAGPVYRDHEVFLRLILTDATVDVAMDGPLGTLQWAASDVASNHAGPAAFAAATGILQTKDGPVSLDHERFVVPAGSRLDLRPANGRQLAADLDGFAGPATDSAGVVPALAASPLAFLVALFALAAAGAWMVLRRRDATLEAMEQALAGGRHRRAARLAAVLLRRDPNQEDARLGRAIALTKAGRAARAAREVQAHLASANPSDGSLHYVLGLALLDRGKEAAGREALREAMRRTPELEADVRKRSLEALPPQPRPQAFKEGYSYV